MVRTTTDDLGFGVGLDAGLEQVAPPIVVVVGVGGLVGDGDGDAQLALL